MDFKDDRCVVSYSLDPEQLDENKTEQGQIIIENTYQKIVVNVIVKAAEEGSRVIVHRDHDRRLKKLEIAAVLHNYLDYRTGLLSIEQFIENNKIRLYKT